MKLILVAGGALVVLAVAAVVIGALLPRYHIASRAILIPQSANAVFAVLEDFANQPSWRTSVQRIEILPPTGGRTTYRETSRNGTITFVVQESVAPQKLVTEIADRNLPFGGTWTFELSARGSGTQVRITERGEVKNPVFRVMAKFVFGYTATMDAYLRDLARKFGTESAPDD